MIKITSNQAVLENKELNFVDMHHHSTISDGKKTPEELAGIFMKKGIGLCLADHNEIRGSLYLAKQKGLFSIPAIEVTSNEAKDVLAYFYSANDLEAFWENEIKNTKITRPLNFQRTKWGILELVDKIKSYNGLPFLAHPFTIPPKTSYGHLFNKEFLQKINGVELFTLWSLNQQQIQFIKELDKPLITGSDSHTLSSFNTLTATREFEIGGFLNEILKKNNLIYHRDVCQIRKIYELWTILKNELKLKPRDIFKLIPLSQALSYLPLLSKKNIKK